MPYIYLSKVNFNSRIYDVHDKKLSLEKILDELYENINDNSKSYKKDSVCRYNDSLGKEHKKEVQEEYLFNKIKKDESEKIITGDLVRINPRVISEFDKEKKDSVLIERNESTEIYFYFDVKNELICFCTRNKFGYNQFNEAFKNLLNLNVKGYGFEVFLKKDKGKVEEGIKRFKRVDKVVGTIIPPNANGSDIEELIKDSSMYKAAKIKKARVEYEASTESSEGLDMRAPIMQQLVKSASNGYGDLNIHGRTNDDSDEVFRSNKDAAISTTIEEDYTEEDFIQRVKKFIIKFV
ncbi:hypothetical protein K1514_16780 [Paraclostridium bifermentans]|uniref:hypothetical protein n=1 Tax=Paraclostridium TaxID=1849822 RepID=UPI001CC80CC7|nr:MULTISPECIES: hypothetical protein [Paraclostridium]MBZ6007548.1 hypothetical protein [Paraclostridium bifermentans]MDU0298428.1 hypothetical protein [Paraclostridium sp. MRS3W1]